MFWLYDILGYKVDGHVNVRFYAFYFISHSQVDSVYRKERHKFYFLNVAIMFQLPFLYHLIITTIMMTIFDDDDNVNGDP